MEGTESVMTYLLDNAQIEAKPPKRLMQRPNITRFREGDVPAAMFTVLCYNVLCSKYATRQIYSYVVLFSFAPTLRLYHARPFSSMYKCIIVSGLKLL